LSPDVKENSSLYKTAKVSQSVNEDRPMSHLFPNLPVGESTSQDSGPGEKAGFKRIGFEKEGRVFTEFAAEFRGTNQIATVPKSRNAGIEEQAEEISKEAYAKGFKEGEKAGMESEKRELKPVLQALNAGILELDSVRSELHFAAEKQAVELGLVIARKIICHEVSINNETIFGVLKEALKKVTDQEEIHIKMNPSDLKAIKDAEFRVSSLGKGVDNVILGPADGISRGECVIETNFGVIDARIDSQIKVVEEGLRIELQKARAGS